MIWHSGRQDISLLGICNDYWFCIAIHFKIAQELFIWAVLYNRHEMALVFWRLTDDALSLGLVGCNLYFRMAICMPSYDTEAKLLLENQKDGLENMLTRILELCYAQSEVIAHFLNTLSFGSLPFRFYRLTTSCFVKWSWYRLKPGYIPQMKRLSFLFKETAFSWLSRFEQ